jgi:hypothetical protein
LLDGIAVVNGPLAQQAFVGGKTPFSVVAQTVGFDPGKSKMLYLSMGID